MNFVSTLTESELIAYIHGLNVGERVVETTFSGLHGRKGTIYVSDDGGKCVL